MPSRTLVAALAAEVIGTFLFFVVGAGAVIMDAQTGGAVGLIGIALAHGLVLAALGTAFAPISGGQFNPVVTVALWSCRPWHRLRPDQWRAVQPGGDRGPLAGWQGPNY
ncbi:MAG: aquaporin [Chloroflexi bacterium]|nr:aquaporin [Chloroflexota bacterium]